METEDGRRKFLNFLRKTQKIGQCETLKVVSGILFALLSTMKSCDKSMIGRCVLGSKVIGTVETLSREEVFIVSNLMEEKILIFHFINVCLT